MLVPNVTKRDLSSFALSFQTDSGRQLDADGIDFYLMTKREMEDRDRDEEAKGRVSIHAVALGGAVWLANPFDEKDLDAATLWGVGARTGYGFNRYLAFEGELIYAWSEEAHFDEVMTRTAKLGRASAGLQLSLGYTIIPIFRAGVGLQGVSHDARMSVGTEVETNFELDAVWYFSAGVDLRIMKGLKLGADVIALAEASQMAGEGTKASLQGGVHASWSWQP